MNSFLIVLPGLSGLSYAVGSFCYKAAINQGVGVTRLYILQSWLSLPVFLVPTVLFWVPIPYDQWHIPVLTGVTFFLGWLGALMAIRHGDVSLQAPLMGMKIILVALLAVGLGYRAFSPLMWIAVFIATAAVFILGYPKGHELKALRITIGWAMFSCLFFAFSDILMAHFASSLGTYPFLFAAMVVNALLTLFLLPMIRKNQTETIRNAFKSGTSGALFMVLQVFTFVAFIGMTGQATEANILFSLRGLFAVLLGGTAARVMHVPGEKLTPGVFRRRIVGAVLMTLSITVMFM